jgi:hypothetical protein
MGREDRLPAELDAVRHGARPAFARARADQLAPELGQAAEHSEHEATVRRQRREAIKRVNAEKESLGEIARSYNVSRWTISRLGSAFS